MKKLVRFSCFVAVVTIIFSCQKNGLDPDINSIQSGRYVTDVTPAQKNGFVERTYGEPCEPTTVMLVAGQTIDAGTVTVTNDANYIYVTYTTTNGWVLSQTHLYVGDCALIPINNPGNPIPGQFPYAGTHNNLTTYTYQIPISKIPLEACGCIAAHAVVKKYNASNQLIDTQTGWGNGVRINLTGGNWGMKFDYCSCTP